MRDNYWLLARGLVVSVLISLVSNCGYDPCHVYKTTGDVMVEARYQVTYDDDRRRSHELCDG